MKANPSCVTAYDPPTGSLSRSGITGGVRAPGDPANLIIEIVDSNFKGQRFCLVNRHLATGREERACANLDLNGVWNNNGQKITTPIPTNWPLGEWQTFVEWPDGSSSECGGFLLQAERTQRDLPGEVLAESGITPTMVIGGAVILAALIFFGGRK